MGGECRERGSSSPQADSRATERRLAALAGEQHGIVALGQLRGLGFSLAQVKHRMRCGRLHRIHRGVYAVGHGALGSRARWMAATLAVPAAVLSHGAAAALWRLRGWGGGAIHITAAARTMQRGALRPHFRDLPYDERTVHDGIPVTTLARTLLDLAATEGSRALERALREATYLSLTDPAGLPALVARYPGARGTAAAAAVLADTTYVMRTRSELEARFLEFLRERRLPLPETNVGIEAGGRRFEVDCIWRGPGLVVELDGRAAHLSPSRAEGDRERDGWLGARGLIVSRVTWRRLARDPDGLESQLRMALT